MDDFKADETYMGRQRRKGDKRENHHKPRGPGETPKTPVIGWVDRGGKSIAKMVDSVITDRVKEVIFLNMPSCQSTHTTGKSPIYCFLDGYMKHKSINHNVQHVNGTVHTNTIEGFWSRTNVLGME